MVYVLSRIGKSIHATLKWSETESQEQENCQVDRQRSTAPLSTSLETAEYSLIDLSGTSSFDAQDKDDDDSHSDNDEDNQVQLEGKKSTEYQVRNLEGSSYRFQGQRYNCKHQHLVDKQSV